MREMKDSGVAWIGTIPKQWCVVRLKNKYTFGKGLSITKADLVDEGVPVVSYGQIHSKNNTGTHLSPDLIRFVPDKFMRLAPSSILKEGDIVIADTSEDLDGVGNAAYMDWNGIVFAGYHTVVLRPKDVLISKYVAYLFRTDAFRSQMRTQVSGIKVFSVTQKIIKSCIFPLPVDDDICSIVAYLDRKCAEIDAFAADIQTQIDMLEQYKRTAITEAVTNGINPNAEMKDSGVGWIGLMPSHWSIIRGKYILRYMQKPIREDDGVVTCFRDGEVTLRSNRREDGFTISEKEIGYQGIDVGDLIVHGMDGFAGSIGVSDSRGKASPVLNVLDTDQNKRYIMYYLRSMAYSDVFLALATGIRVRSCDLRWNKLAELVYPVPPIEEQNAIVQYIDETLTASDAIIADKKAQLDVLDQYKKSLIYEYVTGKREVM